MSLIVTPRQFARQAAFYYQFAQMTAAGLGVDAALAQIERHPPGRNFREPLQRLRAELAQGHTFADATRQLGNWLPEFDLALLDAGERSGRLDAGCRLLAAYYENCAIAAKQIISQLVYPVGLLHFAALVVLVILPFASSQFQASLAALLLRAALILAPLYLATFAILYATQGKHGEPFRAVMESVLLRVPLLGAARRNLALARLAAALEALTSAGVNIIQAWEVAARASGSPALKRAVAAMIPEINAGQTPADMVNQHPEFPEMFANLYATGEVSGQLDDTLRRLHTHYQTEGHQQLHAFSVWLPRLIYGLVIAVVTYYIFQFWIGYSHQISSLL